MKALISLIKEAFFPKTCAACGEITADGEPLCDYCREMLVRFDPMKRCIRCGTEKPGCDCRYRVFHFDGLIAPFENKDTAKLGVYAFKFRRKMGNADYFAEQMAFCVKNEYRDIRFDAVTFVPMHRLRFLKRGFNQSRVLAEKISDILNIPLAETLVTLKAGKRQHDLFGKERFQNVKGRYSAKADAGGKTLLLVDDIKTTGATLDECAKQLFSAGADGVYCVTALISRRKKQEENNTGKNLKTMI